MIAVETDGEEVELAWGNFGIRRTDFRPHWDGDYVNVFSTVEPQASEDATAEYMRDCAIGLVDWILMNRDQFGKEDRFQVIIGWPKSIRETERQVIKTGGTYQELRQIVRGGIPVEPRKHWSVGVFGRAFGWLGYSWMGAAVLMSFTDFSR